MTTATAYAAGTPDRALAIRAGLIGGLVGGVIIWIYEAIVWVGVQHLMPLAGIPRNATGLVFGKEVQDSLGALAYVVGTVHGQGFARIFATNTFARRRISRSTIMPQENHGRCRASTSIVRAAAIPRYLSTN